MLETKSLFFIKYNLYLILIILISIVREKKKENKKKFTYV